MNADNILNGMPFTMHYAKPMRQSQHSDTAQAFQDGLQRTNSKKRVVFVGSKSCKECSEIKGFEEFRVSITTKDGRRGMCRACECRISKARYQEGKKVV